MDSERILEIMQRAETFPKKQPFRPQLNPITSKGMMRGVAANSSGKKTASGGIVVGSGLARETSGQSSSGGSAGLTQAGKPLRVMPNQDGGSAGKMKIKLVR